MTTPKVGSYECHFETMDSARTFSAELKKSLVRHILRLAPWQVPESSPH